MTLRMEEHFAQEMEKHSSRRINKTDDTSGDVGVDSTSSDIGLLSSGGGGKASEVWGLLKTSNDSGTSTRSSSSQPSESIWSSSDKPDSSAWKSSGSGMLHQNGSLEPWSGSSTGWGGRKSGSGWGSPNASPTPNAGTEGWGMTPPSVPQSWSQETRPNSGWERPEDKFGWKKTQGVSENCSESKTDPGVNVWSHLQTKPTGDSAWTAAQGEEKSGSQWGGPGVLRGNSGSQSSWENRFPPGNSTSQTTSKSWGWAGPSPTATAGAEQQSAPTQHLSTSPAVALPAPSTWAQAAGRGLNISNSSKPTEGAPAAPSTPGSSSSASLTKEDLIAQLVNSKDGWGRTPIRQDTTWDLEEGPSSSSQASFAASSSRRMSSSSAVAVGRSPASSSSVVPSESSAASLTNICLANTGTAIWESSRENASAVATPPSSKSPSVAPIGSKDLGAKDRTTGASISGKPLLGGTVSGSWGSQPGEFADVLLAPSGGGSQLPSLELNCDKSGGGGGGVWNMPESASSIRCTSAAPDTPWNPRGGKDTAVWESNRGPPSWSDGPKLGSSSIDAPVLRHDSSSGGWNLEKEAASGLRDSTGQRNDVFDGSRSSHDQAQSWRAPGSSSSSSLASQATSLSQGRVKPNDVNKDGGGGGIWQPHLSLSPAAASEWTTATDQADAGLSLWNPTSMTKPNAGWGEGPWSTKLKTPSSSAWNDGSEMYSAGDDRKLFGYEPSSKSVQPNKNSILQQLIDLGFHKEDVQAALHSNNMNIEQATSELLSNDNRKSADHDSSSSSASSSITNGQQKHHGGQGMPGSTDLSSLSIPDGSTSFGHPGGILTHLSSSTESQTQPPNNSLPRTSLQTPSSLVANLARSVTPNLQQPQQFASGLNTQGPVVPPPLSSQLSGRQPQQQQQQQVVQNQMLQQLKMAMQSGLMSHQPPNPIPSPALLLGLRQLVQLQNVLDWLLIQHQVLIQQNRNIGLVQPGQVEQLLVNIQNMKQQIVQQKWKIGQLQKQATAPSSAVPPWPPAIDQYKDFPPKDEPFNPWRVAPPPTHAPPPTATLPTLDGLAGLQPPLSVDLGSKPHSGLPMMNPPYLSDGAWPVPPSWPSSSSSGATVTTSSLSDAGSAGGAIDSKGDVDGGKGASGAAAAAEMVSASTSMSDIKQPNPSEAVLDIEEFIPGKPWQGGKGADDDPYVNMSRGVGGGGGGFGMGSMIEPQHILNALGRSNSTSDSHWLATSLGMTGTGAGQNHLREAAAWASGGPPSANQLDRHQPWGQAKNTRPPPGLQQSAYGRSVSWTPGTGNRGDAWMPGSASNSLVLKNFPNQIDSTIAKALCQQHGPVQVFRYNPANRQVFVNYRNREDAIQARLALHSCVLANTSLIAEFIPDAEAARMLDQLDAGMQGGGAWPQTRGAGPMKKTVDAASYWNGASSSFWEGYGGIWGPAAAAAGAEEHHHGGDLLGSQ